jgi:hypothetical protein
MKGPKSFNLGHPASLQNEIYDDAEIEWDEVQEKAQADQKSASKKYKMQFKQITDNEKTEIMKKIQTDGTMSFKVDKQQIDFDLKASRKDTNETIVTKEQDEEFFNDDREDENQLAISKENKEDLKQEEKTEDKIDVSKITKVEDIEASVSKTPTKPVPEPVVPKQEAPIKVISAEELEKAQAPLPQELPAPKSVSSPPLKISSPPIIPPEQNSMLNYSQMSNYQGQVEMENQLKMIEQLNQEEIKKVIMQNQNYMSQFQGSSSQKDISGIHTDLNPFENILRDNPASQWLYKDPQGFVRGPFTCFDMYTWHNEGYFSEDLELSLDGHNFFMLRDLKAVSQRSSSSHLDEQAAYQQMQMSQMYAHGGHSPNLMQAQMYGQHQNMGYNPSGGYPQQMAYAQFEDGSYGQAHNFEHANAHYSQVTQMGEGNYGYNPYYHQ